MLTPWPLASIARRQNAQLPLRPSPFGREGRGHAPAGKFWCWEFLRHGAEISCQSDKFDAEIDAEIDVDAEIGVIWREGFCDMGLGGFKAHSEAHGHRLPRQVGLGPTGMARQFREVVVAGGEAGKGDGSRLTGIGARGTDEVAVKKDGRVGRPKFAGERPWEKDGVSRRTWERRRKAEGQV